MRKLLIAGILLAPFFAFAQQVAKSLTASNGVFIGFYEYKPTDYNANPTTQYPVIIFLHGIGERGDGVANLPLVLGQGIPKNINQGHTMRFFWNGKWETFLVLSPQLSNSYGDWPAFYVEEMIKYAKQNMRIDPNRIFLTGLSLGGGGVWRYASASSTNARELAGIAPVCGTCAMNNAPNITGANLPVWAFHAQDDGVVGVGCTTSAILALNNLNPPVKPLMTLYPNGGHFIWNWSYDTEYNSHNPNMYEWFLGQNKSLAPNILPTANAGADISVNIGATANLNGSSSTDADGNIVRYIWRQISGPSNSNVMTGVSTNGQTSVQNLTTLGTYQYELKVIDSRAGISIDNVNVNVVNGGGGGNTPPVARAGSDITITLPTNNTTLNGSTSSDADGSITAYNWSKISGPAQFTLANAGSSSTALSNLAQGTYTFRLTVTDNGGATHTDDVNITVNQAVAIPPPTNQPPVANAGPDVSMAFPANSTTLSASGSTDADGTIASYTWSMIGGPSQYTVSNLNSSSLSVSNLVQGTYSFQLRVVDNSGAMAFDYVVVNVNAASSNQPPVANAGANFSITLPTTNATLNGSNSYDSDGNIVTWNWTKLTGPSQYTIGSPSASSTSVSNLAQGTYEFRLTITDNNGASSSSTVSLVVNPGAAPGPNPQLPVAKAGPDVSTTLPTNSVTLDGINSYDPDGIVTNWTWSKISGPSQSNINSPNGIATSVTNLAQGIYKFALRVTDNSGNTMSDTVNVTVNVAGGANQAPTANAGADVNLSLPANSTTLNASASTDGDGTIASYAWSVIGGPSQYTVSNLNSSSLSVSNLIQGTYSFQLRVVDNNGAMGFDYVVVTVGTGGSNLKPVANAGANFAITLPTNSATLNGYSSYDPDGSITTSSWSKISGPAQGTITSPSLLTTSVTNLAQGTYLFQLLVTDNSGGVGADTVRIVVNPGAIQVPGGTAPVSKAGADISINSPVNSVTLNGHSSYDPDGSIVAWSWTKVSGPSQSNITTPSAGSTTVTNLVQGTYIFRFTVTDNSGLTGYDDVTVTVNGATAGLSTQKATSIVIDQPAEEKMTVYPNPASSTTNIRLEGANTGSSTLTIYDASGKAVRVVQFVKNNLVHELPVNISSLKTGIYYAEVITGKNKKQVAKFLKQ